MRGVGSAYILARHTAVFSKPTLEFAFAKFIALGDSDKPYPEVSFGRSAVLVGFD